jgi:hypothetical protein
MIKCRKVRSMLYHDAFCIGVSKTSVLVLVDVDDDDDDDDDNIKR